MKQILLFILGLIITVGVYAADKVPPNFQAVLLSKIIALDNTLQNSAKETLEMAVFYDPNNPVSVKSKSEFVKVFNTLDMYGKPVDTSEVTDVNELKSYDLVYVAELDESSFDAMIKVVVENKILSIGVNDEYAKKGCALGFSIVGGRPKVLMNQAAVDEIGADFALQVMLIAEVI